VTGGRTNFGTVEIEWTANSERDVIGYQVMRQGESTPVCAIATQQLNTTCTDTSPPDGPLAIYYVYAYDKDPSGNLRASHASSPLFVTEFNRPPHPPTGLTLARLSDGSVKLTWNRPDPQDPDLGDSANFFRIYRDGKALVNRYDRYFDDTNGSTLTWTDTTAGASAQTYYVTTVDEHYAESEHVGPVTG
jgi:hypothetical protein